MTFAVFHKKMVRNSFLNIEILLNEDETEISEYDIQAFMFLFFRRHLKNTNYFAARESSGKVDCVIYEKQIPCIFYEIKTYFKSRETILKAHFEKDIEKLAELVLNNKNAKGYFFTAGLTKKFSNKGALSLSFIKSHLGNDKKWQKHTLKNGVNIRLRPSVKFTHGMCNVMSWEIKL